MASMAYTVLALFSVQQGYSCLYLCTLIALCCNVVEVQLPRSLCAFVLLYIPTDCRSNCASSVFESFLFVLSDGMQGHVYHLVHDNASTASSLRIIECSHS